MNNPLTLSCDCAVIGAGPGGLAAAVYLARSNRHVLVFDGGKPRAAWSPWNRNYPGFPEGVAGVDLVSRFREQAEEFDVQFVPDRVTSVGQADGKFTIDAGELGVEARRLILATGVTDVWPDVPNVDSLKGSRIRVCPICDAYEANGRRVGLIGCGDKAAREALYLRKFTGDMALFTHGLREERPICQELTERHAGEEIATYDARVEKLVPLGEEGVSVCLADGQEIPIDLLFSGLGAHPNTELAEPLGIALDEDGYIKVDRWQATNVPNLYAVGDVTCAINQVTVAVGQAAVAAVAVHNSLLDF
ncbi:MAG TPA: NAD(P)/FAD-dependent oxidoreductase [Armatimonadota bacterium]|nr:NAD(P)/FAD-dependent oxidoreductase [Armatimonadota bacterium]